MNGPWRDVVYIGVQVGVHGGKAWALVLDCGHTVYKSIQPFSIGRAIAERFKVRTAPKRMRCYHCDLGSPPADLDVAISFARRIYEGSLELL